MKTSGFIGIRFFALCVLAAALLPGGSVRALTITRVTSDNGYPAHKVYWTDAAGLPRTAVMVDQNSTGNGPYTGYLRQYTYQVNGQTHICTGSFNYVDGEDLEFSGDGFVQNHTADGGDFSTGNGAGTPGTTTVTLQGTNHAIITYNIPTYQISGQTVPTTVQWFFADGRSHPIFAVSQDARATSGNLGSDSNSPYGDMAYDGDGTDAFVGGFSWGDTYKFVTLASNPEEVTEQTPWIDTAVNSIPYAMQWAEPATADAEMGHVATLPISVSDQGQDTETSAANGNLFDPRAKTSPNGPLPPAITWAYQIINYTLPAQGPTDSKRLAWGGNFGRVGGFDNYGDTTLNPKQYSQHSTDPLNAPLTGVRADALLTAYSTFIVLGPHAGSYLNGAVGQSITQMETAARSSLTAAVGAVVTNGPAGVGNAATTAIPYTPAGYNPTYSTWDVNAAQNAVDVTLTPPANGFLDHPIFVVHGYTDPQLTSAISVNGLNTPGANYFATLDPVSQQLWITINGVMTTPVHLLVGTPGAAPIITNPTSALAQVGVPFGFALSATNVPTSFAASGLPPGLSLDSLHGLISGTPTEAGTFTASVSATNASGTAMAAFTMTVTVPPADIQAINILSPPTDINIVLGETVHLAVTVSAVPGALAGLTLDADNVATGEQSFLGNTTAPSDQVTWQPTEVGDYMLAASATDTNGVGYGSQIPVHVISGSNPPLSLLLSGLNGRSFAAGSTVPLVAFGKTANGTPLRSVQIFANGAPIASIPSDTNAVAPGGTVQQKDDAVSDFVQRTLFLGNIIEDLLLTVVTTDNNGVSTVSGSQTVHVTAPVGGDALKCVITSPTVGSTISTSATATATVIAKRASGGVRKVEFFIDSRSVGTVTTAPFVFNVSLPGAGSHALTAIATDEQGTSKASKAVIVNAVAIPVVTVVTAGDGLAVEGGEKGKVLVERTGSTSAPLTVLYKVKGSAKAGVDFKPLPGVVTIPAGSSKAKVKIKPIDNDVHDGTTKAKVKLLPSTDGTYLLGAEVLAKVKVLDND